MKIKICMMFTAAILVSLAGCAKGTDSQSELLSDTEAAKEEIVSESPAKEKEYNAAMELYNQGKYEDAVNAFIELQRYKDSLEQIEKCREAIKDEKYNSAIKSYNEGNYEDALSTFIELDGYNDSTEQIEKCNDAIKAEKYEKAVALMNSKDYEESYRLLNGLNYKDSAEKLDSVRQRYRENVLRNAQIGSYIFFGSYEQDNVVSDGKEDIEWLVLDKEAGKVLVISRYALDDSYYSENLEDVPWENCHLRQWLNDTFINNAFDAEEQSKIISTVVKADDNPEYGTLQGNDTVDKVFLLSIPEVDKYFGTYSDRQCRGTEYCYSQGTVKTNNEKYSGNCWWWLRIPGDNSKFAVVVEDDGSFEMGGDRITLPGQAVRPAMWIELG